MSIKLSNAIVKVYKKRNGKIAFHYKTELLIKTNCVYNYEDKIDICFILPNKKVIELGIDYILENLYTSIDGILPLTLKCVKISENIELVSSIIKIIIKYDFNISGYFEKHEITTFGILKKMY